MGFCSQKAHHTKCSTSSSARIETSAQIHRLCLPHRRCPARHRRATLWWAIPTHPTSASCWFHRSEHWLYCSGSDTSRLREKGGEWAWGWRPPLKTSSGERRWSSWGFMRWEDGGLTRMGTEEKESHGDGAHICDLIAFQLAVPVPHQCPTLMLPYPVC